MKIIDKDETVQELNTGFERWDIGTTSRKSTSQTEIFHLA